MIYRIVRHRFWKTMTMERLVYLSIFLMSVFGVIIVLPVFYLNDKQLRAYQGLQMEFQIGMSTFAGIYLSYMGLPAVSSLLDWLSRRREDGLALEDSRVRRSTR